MKNINLILVAFLFALSQTVFGQDPLFPNSVVSNDIDFIQESDPDSFSGLSFVGRQDREMPGDPSGGGLFDNDTFLFEASFTDGESMEIWCHSSFITEDAAREYAEKLGPRLGKLPAFQRNMVNHVVIHSGDRTAFAEIEGQFFVLYSENMDRRISTNDLEETVFHESVHASYQFMYEDHPDWTSAQAADPSFVTVYAQENPQLEDLAESALFAYTYLTYPGRLSTNVESWLEENIPNRLEFFGAFYSETTSTLNLFPKSKLVISPNPSNDLFVIQSESTLLQGDARITDMHGRTVKVINCHHAESITIDLSGFDNGLYVVSINGYSNERLLKYNVH
jgi:hypothetical protein